MKEEEIEEYKSSLIVKLTEKDYTIDEEAAHFWKEISTHRYIFDKR